MARQIINLGATAGDKTGTKARAAGTIINENFEELYMFVDILSRISIITEATGSSLTDDDFTVNANWVWLIDNIQYTNPADVVIEDIPLSAAGKTRLVYIVPNKLNSFEMISGPETTGTPAAPALNYGNMYVTFFEVTDSAIGTPAPFYFGDSLADKLARGTYTGNADDLLQEAKDYADNIGVPEKDAVLKVTEIVVTDLEFTVLEGDFAWRLDGNEFENVEFAGVLDPTEEEGYFRYDILQGSNSGVLSIKKGEESEEVGVPPIADVNNITLATLLVIGEAVSPTPNPDYNSLFLKRYKTTYKTSQSSFDLNPNEDDYNVIFINTSTSTIKIHPDGTANKFIKNGAIYPFKSMGTGDVLVEAKPGVTLNAPNGLTLSKNQQCYIIKDDANEWTFVNPRNLQNVDNTADADKPVSIHQAAADAQVLADANAYTDSVAATKLDASAYNDRFKGVYLTEAALNSAHPTANVGDYAQVNEVGATDVVNYNWDAEEEIWVKNATSGGSGAANTDELPEGSTNLYWTPARGLANLLSGLSAAAGTFTSSDTVLTAFGKIKYLIDNIASIYATLVSPNFTGTPTAPTASVGTNTTQIATMAAIINADLTNVKTHSDQEINGNKEFEEIVISKKGYKVISESYNNTYISPDLPAALVQGYTFDGTYHYLFGTSSISKRDASYVSVLENATALSGLSGVNHIGDGVYLGGFLYAPVMDYPSKTKMLIVKYNATTLALVTSYDITAQGHEVSAIATDGTTLFITSYNDGTKIWKYDLIGNYLGYITLSTPLTNGVQGITYYDGWLYVIEQEDYFKVSLDGITVLHLGVLPGDIAYTHRGTGLENVGGVLRIGINITSKVNVYYLSLTENTVCYIDSQGNVTANNFKLITPVVEKSTSFTLDDTYCGKIVILTSSCTVTLPNGLAIGFNVTITTLSGATLTLAKGDSVTLFNNVGLTMAENLSCTIQSRLTVNNYITAGNL